MGQEVEQTMQFLANLAEQTKLLRAEMNGLAVKQAGLTSPLDNAAAFGKSSRGALGR